MKRTHHILGIASNALASLAPQFAALIVLKAADFGYFSLVYLLFALGTSAILALVAEPWARQFVGVLGDYLSEHSVEYHRVVAFVALVTAGATLCLCWVLPDLRTSSLVAALAVSASTYRVGARFFEIRTNQLLRAARADLLVVAGLTVSLSLALTISSPSLFVVFACWSIGSGLSALSSNTLSLPTYRVFAEWLRRHSAQVRPLLKDTVLTDVGSVGGYYAMAPLLGISAFGVYRAISNVGAPVRLILTPLRPIIGGSTRSRVLSGLATTTVLVSSLIMGGVAFGVLKLLPDSGLPLGVLLDLAQFALPVGIYVAANLLGQYQYLYCRYFSAPRYLIRARYIQTFVSLAIPITAAIVGGLTAAVWAQAGIQGVACVVWYIVSRPRYDAPPSVRMGGA